jgi:DNA-directed RNA polymerase specialized sigma24 family protein
VPRQTSNVAREKVTRAKGQIQRIEATLEVARRDGRRAILAAFEAGLTQTELATIWGTSQTRMRENIIRAKAERDGVI